MARQSAEDLFALLSDEISDYACRHCSALVAEDVMSETFVTVLRKEDQIPEDVEAARAWVYTIARNHLAHAHRARARQVRLAHRLEAAVQVGIAVQIPDVIAEVLEGVCVNAALQSLAPLDQEVLMLTAVEQLDISHGAAFLGISSAAFSSRLRRARARFRVALSQAGVDLPRPQGRLVSQVKEGAERVL